MSHYARLVAPLKVVSCYGVADVLPVNTLVKRVKLEDGEFRFMASMKPDALHEGWLEWHTTEDLPAFTDKGRAHREAHTGRTTLRQGRPTVSTEAATHRLVCKVTEAQAEAVEAIAAAEDTNVPGLIRKALTERGMPE